ncbi:MAG: broad specificity phosphatase PhoE [Paraglaciecola psychrophila]|jgi:broad specificity phosphatase PhoE
MASIHVVRHGQSSWNKSQRWAGHANVALTELGRQQAAQACPGLAELGFERVASSGLNRARETATIISQHCELPLLTANTALNEQHYGELSGLTEDQISRRYPGFMAAWQAGTPLEIPGGELWAEFVARVFTGLAALATLPGKTLVVAHLGVLRAIEHQQGNKQSKHDNLGGLWLEL